MQTETAPVLSARGLCFGYPGRDLFAALGFDIRPGLTLVQGGDGRGKSTLLRIIAGQMAPQAGVVQRNARALFDASLLASASDQTVAQAWLYEQRALLPGWSEPVAADWAAAFALQEHLAKPLYMLSTGSRRKLGLVAAAASGAQLTLLDCPFAALDAASCRVLDQLLQWAAGDRQRAWVLADYAPPAGVPRAQLAGFIDLGD
jgi:ABC-type transport system involved in cytochrome c biogenesis ATPase subunit